MFEAIYLMNYTNYSVSYYQDNPINVPLVKKSSN